MNQKKDNIEWRRSKVQELLVKGYNHYEISYYYYEISHKIVNQVFLYYSSAKLLPYTELNLLNIIAQSAVSKV